MSSVLDQDLARPSDHVSGYSSYVEKFEQALLLEIKAASSNHGQKAFLSEGRHIGRRDKWDMYSFTSDRELTFPDDTEVKLEYQGKEHVGCIISNEGFIVILGVDAYIGEVVPNLVLITNPIFLLQKLIERLKEAPQKQGANTGLAYKILQRVDLAAGYPDGDKNATKLLSGIGQQLGKPLDYNEDQFKAVATVLGREISFIWGPPGTGKTKTLGMAVAALAEAGESVLVVAHSNAAVDVAMLSVGHNLHRSQPYDEGKVLRFGIIRNTDLDQYSNLHVRGVVERQNPALISELKSLEKNRQDLAKQTRADNLDKSGLLASRIETVTARLKELTNQLHELELELVRKAQVVGCTLSKMTIAPEVHTRQFDTVIIDEASMAFIPHCVLAATLAAHRIAIFGDFRQLEPICQSEEEAAREWLHRDIFEQSGITLHVETGQTDRRLVMLRTQYRMHPDISAIPNRFFYKSQLKDGPSVVRQAEPIVRSKPSPGSAVVFYDTSTLMGAYCFSERQTYSRFNPISALFAVSQAYQIVKSEGKSGIGIITPYAAQSRLIHKLLRDLNVKPNDIKVATVHRFQGAEQGYIIFDAVEGYPKNKAGKLVIGGMDSTAMRLANVAISRAQGKFISVVHRNYLKATLGEKDIFGKVFDQIATQHRPKSPYWSASQSGDGWQPNLPGVTFYLSAITAARDLEKDILTAKEEIAINWPVGVTPGMLFAVNRLKSVNHEKVRIYVGRKEQAEFASGLPNTLIWHSPLQTNMGLLGFDRNSLWIYLDPNNPSAPVLKLALPETVKLLHLFWSLLPEDDMKQDTMANRVKAGQSPVGEPCIRCRGDMWIGTDDWGTKMICTKCGYKRKITPNEATDLARLHNLTCKNCGGQVKGRRGSLGDIFLGCTNYPNCKWTAPFEAIL